MFPPTLHLFSPAEAEDFAARGVWLDALLLSYLERWATERGDRVALVDREGELTWAALLEHTSRAIRGLARLGVGPGVAVGIQLPNHRSATIAHVAIEALGGVSLPMPPIYRGRDLSHILEITRAKVLLTVDRHRNQDNLPMLRELKAQQQALEHVVLLAPSEEITDSSWTSWAAVLDRNDDDMPALGGDPRAVSEIAFTSGSTGSPKGVMHSANTLNVEHLTIARGFQIDADSIVFMPSTVGHQLGFSLGIRMPILVGAKVVFQDPWSPETAAALIEREQATFTLTTPTFLVDLLDRGRVEEHRRLPSLRTWGLAGAVVPPALHARARDALPSLRLAHVFGMTEIGGMILNLPDADEETRLATGKAQPEASIRVVVDGRDVASSEEGELCVRSPSLFLGYLGGEDSIPLTDDGYFRTGDRVRRDAADRIFVTGRMKELIKRGGENVSPVEIEQVLAGLDGLAEIAVIGVPDERLGERVCACVVPREGQVVTLEAIQAALERASVTRQKWPEVLHSFEVFPRTSIGKVNKAALKAQVMCLKTL